MVGVLGAVLIGAFIDRTLKYKYTMISITFSITLATIMEIVSLTWFFEGNSFLGWILFLGLFCTAYVPLCISYGAELTFPLSPALVVGTLTLMGSAASFLLSLLGAFIIHEGKEDDLLSEDDLIQVRRWRSKSVISILGVASFIAFILSFFIEEDLKRHRYA